MLNNKSSFVFFVFLPILLTLSGCGVVPPNVVVGASSASVKESKSIGYPFRLRSSIILLTQDPKTNTFKAQSSPNELDSEGRYSPVFYVAGVDNYRSTTQLKVSYIDNTKMIDKLQITTKDNVADTINKIGTVASALAPIVAGSVAGQLEVATKRFSDTTFDPGAIQANVWKVDSINAGYCLRQRDVSTEQGMTMSEYLGQAGKSNAGDFPVASCVTAILDIAECSGGTEPRSMLASLRVTYASATQVTPMPLPSSGEIKMNSVCGASVTEADKQDRSDLATYLTTLIANVNSVKAAAKKKP